MSIRREKVVFDNGRGEKLSARLDLAPAPRAFALFAHCFTCSKDIAAASRISRALGERGIAVLRFDFTGLGSSEGEFANTNFSSNVEDLVAAADALRQRWKAPSLLIGHSLGGAAVLSAAGDVPECRAVVAIGAPSDTQHVRHLLTESIPEIEARGDAEVDLAGRRFRIRRQFLEDIASHNLEPKIRRLRRALLVLHSPIDATVSVEHAARIFMAARHPKSFISLDDADHLLTRKSDSEYAAEVLAAWASRYLDSQPPQPVSPSIPDGVIQVESLERNLTQLASGRGHRLLVDEPVEMGGDDQGLTPPELLIASLGSCMTITARMYARRKGWPLERISARLAHSKVSVEEGEASSSADGKIDQFEVEVRMTGELTSQQRRRILEIASRCPVHRTLKSENRIVSRLLEE